MKDFTVDLADLKFVGHDLARPECVLAEKDGTLWASDRRGLVTRIDQDGTQMLLGSAGGQPNGMAMDSAGNLYIANMADGKLYKLHRDGTEDVIFSEWKGFPLGAANFVFIDSQDRLWLSFFTRENPWIKATINPRPDGYIMLLDGDGPRIMADGIIGANEVRLDANEAYVYVAETLTCRILRFPINPDGNLGRREVFGPETLGHGAYVDGFAFDIEGNLWVTTVTRNGLGIITPDGDYHTVFEDAKPNVVDTVVQGIAHGTLTADQSKACAGETLQFPTSITFGGPGLKTVYLGSLAMPHLVTFQSPIAGLPMRHWQA